MMIILVQETAREKNPTVNFHLICTNYRVQIKHVGAYPGRRLQCSHEVLNSFMGLEEEGEGGRSRELIDWPEIFYNIL